MKHKDFLQAVLKPTGEVFQYILAQRSNPLIDYTQELIMQEIIPNLKQDITETEKNKLEEEILSFLVNLSDQSAKIGIDTASMLLAGVDPFNNYTKTKTTPEKIRQKRRETKNT